MGTTNRSLVSRFYPEVAVGGFTRVDGTVHFYQRVRSLISPEDRVVDFGAGRGRFVEDEKRPFVRKLRLFRGSVREVVGVDVDPVVLRNNAVDVAYIVQPGSEIPLAGGSVDIVVSDYTFEHVADPSWVASELGRILKPGGWICARTPNKWGAIALPSRLVPSRYHDAVLRVVQPSKSEVDTFPTLYRMNTAATLRRFFPSGQFDVYCFTHESQPAYAASSVVGWRLTRAIARVTPERFGSMLFVFMRKREASWVARPE